MKTRNFIDVVIILFIVFSFVSWVIGKKRWDEYNTNYNHKIDSLQIEYNLLRIEYNNSINYYDSIINYSDSILADIEYKQIKTIKYYERRIKDLNDINIVDNDSVTSYISSRIYNSR